MENQNYNRKFSDRDGFINYIEAFTYAAKPNTEYEAHAHHDELEIYRFIKGDLFFAFEGERIDVKAGDIIIIASGTMHRPIIKTTCEYHRQHLLISNGFFVRLNGGQELQRLINKRKIMKFDEKTVRENRLDELFCLIAERLKNTTSYGELCTTVAICSFLIEVERLCEKDGTGQLYSGNGKLHGIIEYIDKNISSPMDYKSISNDFHISEKSLYKLFKSETGFTLSKYITERRIIKAKLLLNAGAMPHEAAFQSGFLDYSVFFRSFVSKTGMTPSKYTAKLKEANKNG